ncbi:PKD domain-containing protein [Candidatus Chloroploca sp. M-50]|uniref:PKD domain-containing protein n=1 Tax=Candidatus Chloroploca mongolica TaxID=2528176 RepID=A0ABS4D7D7_9CHLR|nr:PKD domain-containing protein [Candidatus Chloroploca mongolica]MBP1465345.1 PKD domain-containing protein [Candidatus Chloroploca mongolica]
MVAQRLRPLALLAVFALLLTFLFPLIFPIAAQPTTANLLSNGDFEQGTTAPWQGITSTQLTTDYAASGQSSVRITSQEASQGWINVQAGQEYVLTAWFRWSRFAGNQWGYAHLTVEDTAYRELGSIINPQTSYERDRWHKLALTFTAPTGGVRVRFGLYGPQDDVELYFDDLQLRSRDANVAPTLDPVANTLSGTTPLTVAFEARADDPDGAVRSYRWEFGDGTESRSPDPTHIFRSRGSYPVKLTVWDNDGAAQSQTLTITVTDAVNPAITINAPTTQQIWTTSAASLALEGQASTPTGTLAMLAWDNLRTGAAGSLAVPTEATMTWATPSIALAPGRNDLQVSVVDSRGRAHSARLVVQRQLEAPRIYDVQVQTSTVAVYERYEVRFQVDTVASSPLFSYTDQPPPGVTPGSGVTVEGVITTPSGATVTHPAFFFTSAIRQGQGSSASYAPGTTSGWALRYAPLEPGRHQVYLRVRDASGETMVDIGSFEAGTPRRAGFIGVSSADSRYFQFSDGSLFWPLGPAWAVDLQGGRGFNFERPWLGGLGIYSTNWARWKSTAETLGNEGFSSRLTFLEHYPGHELAQELTYPEGYRLWIGCFGDEAFCPRFKANTDYEVKLRVKVVELAGPRNAAYPYGLVLKFHGWPQEPGFEEAHRNYASLIPPISVDRDWHTVVARYRTGSDEGAGQARGDLSLYLDNVTAGRAYIDELSVREILPGETRGPELIRNPRADLHTYVEQRPAAFLDDQLVRGEADGIYYRYVVHDKNDWIQNHLSRDGIFVASGDGYYQPEGTRARWLLEQWWRYLVARWGYTTAVHSWELNNEGPPDDGSGTHAQMTQDFARFMREQDAHPHMASTSFWCCWEPTFWGDRVRFPDVAYADIHEYPTLDVRLADGSPAVYDVAGFQAETSMAYAADKVGRPIIRGEVGLSGEPVFTMLSQANPGIWFHNLLWAQLNPGAVFDPGYWFSEHFNVIDAQAHAVPFAAFVATLDVQRGGYGDAEARLSNSQLRAYGQRNVARGKAHLWVQNRLHTWRNVMGGAGAVAITPQSGTLSLTLQPNRRYEVAWWDSYAGTVLRRELVTSTANGEITLTITNLASDLALTIEPETPDPEPSATPTTTPGPSATATTTPSPGPSVTPGPSATPGPSVTPGPTPERERIYLPLVRAR